MKIRIILMLVLFLPLQIFGGGRRDSLSEKENLVFTIPCFSASLDDDLFLSDQRDAQRIGGALYQGLFNADHITGKAVPGLCRTWKSDEKSQVFTFFMNDQFWSNGEPLTAFHVASSWKAVMDSSGSPPFQWYFLRFIDGAKDYVKGIIPWERVGIHVIDESTLEVWLTMPTPYFPEVLVHPAFRVMPPAVISGNRIDWDHPENLIVNGPFVPEGRGEAGELVLSGNPYFAQSGTKTSQALVFSPVSSGDEALQKYREGAVHWLPRDMLPSEKLSSLAGRKDFQTGPGLASYFYICNMESKLLQNEKARKALSLALDRQSLIDAVLQGGQLPAWSPVPPMTGFFRRTPGEDLYALRLERAKQLLADAAYTAGEDNDGPELLVIDSPGHKAVAEFLSRQWESALGLRITVRAVDSAAFYSLRKSGRFDLALGGWQSEIQDPLEFLSLFLTDEPLFGGSYSSVEYDNLIISSAMEKDPSVRMAILKQAEERLCGTDAAVIPLYFYTNPQLFRDDIWRGWQSNPLDVHPLEAIAKQ